MDESGPYRDDGDLSWPGGGGPKYEVLHPKTGQPCKVPSRGWRYTKVETMRAGIAKGLVVFGADETTAPSLRTNLFDRTNEVMRSVQFSYAQTATQYLMKLFGGKKVFDNPKNEKDIRDLTAYLTGPDDLVLDFFGGSGTTADAVLRLNAEEGSHRNFILVQLPERTDDESEAAKAGYATISDIAKERIRRVIAELEAARAGQLKLDGHQDFGFRVFKLAESNVIPWDAGVRHDTEALSKQLELQIEHLRPGRTEEDLLYELLLKSGFPLTVAMRSDRLGDSTVSNIADGALVICLAQVLTLDTIKAIAKSRPKRVVCLDSAFEKNDQLKTNAAQIFRTADIVFHTV